MTNPFEKVIGVNTGKTKEDESFNLTDLYTKKCPFNICNGSGIIPSELDQRDATFCKCHKQKILTQKLKNSNINVKFLNKNFDDYDEKTEISLFKPRKTPKAFESSPRIKSVLDENPNNFVKRNYLVNKLKRSPQETLKSYSEKNLELLNKGEPVANLLLFGDPANGKTTFSILTGLYFLNKGKKVYFTTVQEFLDGIFSKEIDPKKISKEVDVLILDELFNEYHTDSQYAKKQLKEIFKIREELNLITICTSNGTPKDFSLLYGESMMSLINGTFFMFHLNRESDARVENMHNMYDEFNF